jgi:hypothetical protein
MRHARRSGGRSRVAREPAPLEIDALTVLLGIDLVEALYQSRNFPFIFYYNTI